jgi:hypothetical protein
MLDMQKLVGSVRSAEEEGTEIRTRNKNISSGSGIMAECVP